MKDPGHTDIINLAQLEAVKFRNVAFKFTDPTESVEEFSRLLTPMLCHFKFLSIFHPISLEPENDFPVFTRLVNDFTQRFDLHACFFGVSGGDVIHDESCGRFKGIYEDWLELLDE